MKIETMKKIKTCGNALGIFFTNEAKIFGLKYGDIVKITIEKVENYE